MNEQLEKFARQTLKDGLSKCTKAQQILFKKMYACDAPELVPGIPHSLYGINYVVDSMPPNKLDWAMRQVERTLDERDDAGSF